MGGRGGVGWKGGGVRNNYLCSREQAKKSKTFSNLSLLAESLCIFFNRNIDCGYSLEAP